MRKIFSTLACAMVLGCHPSYAEDAAIEKTIVFIECAMPNDKTSTGSGVLISPQGHVLTALHVVKGAQSCKGSIGYANPGGGDPLGSQIESNRTDAALLRFNAPHTYDYVRYCRLEDWMVRREIYVSGFPVGTKTGVPSFRKGVLSTVFPQSSGVLETDGQTVMGMSGGPVYASDLKSFIGIVVGAAFDATGTVNYYGILPTDAFRAELDLIPSDQPCYRRSQEVDLPTAADHYEAGDPSIALGVRPDDGQCYLSSVWGQMNDPGDTVEVAVENGGFVLRGTNKNGGFHGGKARCIWFK
ncbi:trypsin-like peptidase domain-containing protein [Rhizobium laguerreae]|uniref:S1 family peptidase n=1 Tax=Rhizobium laguerreae TaxID=1076926 RepID=UPI001C91028D|nr:serine protease [Rhizobium laguerreae]MBY3329011.1 trypsin-like peptidase domain-containing protein [Rhizobium laguerreae]MBY3392089.1 trypsin-like peptidase domain-containing protein [Rhizobium laguerreae]